MMKLALMAMTVAIALMACDKVEVKSMRSQGGGGTSGPAPAGPANSIMSWSGNTSHANMACLSGSTLTIKCRPYNVMGRTLEITISNYSGPGTYLMGGSMSATYYIDNTAFAPPYTSTTASSGYVTITSQYSTVGISGSFDLTLYRSGSSINLSSGVIDQVPMECTWPVSLSYSVGPLTPTHSVSSITNGLWTLQRTGTSAIFKHRNTIGVSNPSTQYNDFTIALPRSITVGTHASPTSISGFSISYIRPSGSHYGSSSASNTLTITAHDAAERTMQGSFSVLLSGSITASGNFNVRY